MKAELSKITSNTVFPEGVVACPILLMNGRVNTKILAAALNYGIRQSEWTVLLDRLYPLIIRVNDDGEYALFHNDFRVFLMGVIHSYQAQYEEIALDLAKYLLQENRGIITYVTGIPLLCCARKEELISKYFTAQFVINALAESVSYERLDEFAHLSYEAACKNQDYDGLRNTYLAIKTFCQHKRYFEYYDKKYKTADYPEISVIDIKEIRDLPIQKENLDEFVNVLTLCEKLYLSGKEEYKKRGLALYNKWFHSYSPLSFVPLCTEGLKKNKLWSFKSTDVGQFLEHWGTIAAEMEVSIANVDGELSNDERNAVLTFGDKYFNYSIQHQKYNLANNALEAGYVGSQTFCENLESIYYAGKASLFADYLIQAYQSNVDLTMRLLALSMKVICDETFQPDHSVLDTLPTIIKIYDQSSYTLVLEAFLLGRINNNLDDSNLLLCSDKYCEGIECNGIEKEQMNMLIRVSVLLGKYYWDTENQSTLFEAYSEQLLSKKLQRSFDYSKARRFLLYTLLKSKKAQIIAKNENFIKAIKVSLFEIDLIGMSYKTSILDYLKEQRRYDIIKEYIDDVYGDNCCKIGREKSKKEMHERFCQYGELVEPNLMKQFSGQLKWDVVNYTSHKEDALQLLTFCFETIVANSLAKWKKLGKELYDQSRIADQYDNYYGYDIEKCIVKSAIKGGIEDYWELGSWNDDFIINPDHIYDVLLEFTHIASNLTDLQVIWTLSCGIHSWYTQTERHQAKIIFDACSTRAHEIDVDFAEYVSETTPEWMSIITYLAGKMRDSDKHYADNNKNQETKKEIIKSYESLSVDEALDHLKTIERSRWANEHYAAVLTKIQTYERESKEYLEYFLRDFGVYLQGKEWSYQNYDNVMSILLSALGRKAFWVFAEANGMHLSDNDYQTSVRNLELLFKTTFCEQLDELEVLFIDELRAQQAWSSGNKHITIENDNAMLKPVFVSKPQSNAEVALYILLKQVDTQNARKIEAAIYAIYLLGVQFPKIITRVVDQWTSFSEVQKECLFINFARWSVDGICNQKTQDFLRDLYNNCSELTNKYYLHSILLTLKDSSVTVDAISCEALAIKYDIPEEDDVEEDNCYRNFISMIECYKGEKEANLIRKCLKNDTPLEKNVEDKYALDGDTCIPVISKYPGKIFYSKEKNGDWKEIPLGIKKARLIPLEDPFLLTDMPKMVFDSKWFPDIANYGKTVRWFRQKRYGINGITV